MDESTFIMSIFFFFISFFDEIHVNKLNIPRWDAAHLGLFCLPMSHKKDARLIWVKIPYLLNVHASQPSQLNLLRPYFFNTLFTDYFSKYLGRRREKNKNKNY